MSKGFHTKRLLLAGSILLFVLLAGCAGRADWVPALTNLCIQVEQSYDGLSYREPIAEELRGVLNRMGVQAAIGESSACTAVWR